MALRGALLASTPWHIVVIGVSIAAATCTSAVLCYVLGGSPSQKRKRMGDSLFLTIFLVTLLLVVCVDVFFHLVLCTPAYMLTGACIAAAVGCCVSILMASVSVEYENSFETFENSFETFENSFETFEGKEGKKKKKHHKRKPRAKKKRAKKPRAKKPRAKKPRAKKPRVRKPRIVKIDTKGEAVRRAIAHGIVAMATGITMLVLR